MYVYDSIRKDVIMSEENKTVELKEEELEKVSGGDDFHYNVSHKEAWKCPKCGNIDADQMRGDNGFKPRIQCQVCWYDGPKDEFKSDHIKAWPPF